MNQVQWILCLRISSRSRSVATIPKSPREIMVGVFSWRERNGEALSRSKVRHTKCCAISTSLKLRLSLIGPTWRMSAERDGRPGPSRLGFGHAHDRCEMMQAPKRSRRFGSETRYLVRREIVGNIFEGGGIEQTTVYDKFSRPCQ